jgi:hypothetical protein
MRLSPAALKPSVVLRFWGQVLWALVVMQTVAGTCRAQGPVWDWAISYGGPGYEYCYDLAVDPEGNIVGTGYFQGIVDFDPGPGVNALDAQGGLGIYLLKLNDQGEHIWAKAIGGPGYKTGANVEIDPAGNIYLSGQFKYSIDFDPGPGTYYLTSNGELDAYIAKFNASGELLWAINFGGADNDAAGNLVLDSVHGALYVASNFSQTVDFDPGPGDSTVQAVNISDAYIARFDTAGIFDWVRTISASVVAHWGGAALSPSGDGGVVCAGYFEGTIDLDPDTTTTLIENSVGGRDAFVCALDSTGELVWAWRIGGPGFEDVRHVASDPSGSLALTGHFQNTMDFDPGAGTTPLTSAGDYDMFVMSITGEGDFAWVRQIPGPNITQGMALLTGALGTGAICATGYNSGIADLDPPPGAGQIVTSAGNDDAIIVCWDSAGQFIFGQSLGGFAPDYLLALAGLPDGSLAMGGSFFSPEIAVGGSMLTNAIDFASTGDGFIARSHMSFTGTPEAGPTTDLLVWPNPVNDRLFLASTMNLSGAAVEFFDMLGKRVLSTRYASCLDVSSIASGAFVMRIHGEDGHARSRTIIIAR